jgi:hypothetical protein
MSINNYIKDISKGLSKKDHSQELSPGHGRRYEPSVGLKKHNERIHKESKIADSKNLPFSFRKPLKVVGRSVGIECPHCGNYIGANTNTVAIICNSCNKFFKIDKLND